MAGNAPLRQKPKNQLYLLRMRTVAMLVGCARGKKMHSVVYERGCRSKDAANFKNYHNVCSSGLIFPHGAQPAPADHDGA
jgi:hypothetical protein